MAQVDDGSSTSDGAPARQRRSLLARAGVALLALGAAAAIVVPTVLRGSAEAGLGQPTVPSALDPTVLRPELIFGSDRAGDLTLPVALSAPADAPTGTEERWRLTPEKVTEIWRTAAPDGGRAEEPLLVTANLAVAGAAHEANVSGVVPIVLAGYGPHGTDEQARLLVALDTEDGAVLWTWAFDAMMPNPCQVVGRGAHVVCATAAGDEDADARSQVTVLATRTGESRASFPTYDCIPATFLQHETRLYWAGILVESMDACLGGGTEHFATLTDGGLVDDYTAWLTMTPTGPLLRAPGASVMLTEAGWRGYHGRVEPGPDGLIVRDVPVGEGSASVTTIVSDIDGATVVRAVGPAWHRLDLLPESAGDPRLSTLVGVGNHAYDASGQQRLTLQPGEQTPVVDVTSAPPPTVTWAGVLAYVTVDRNERTSTTHWWTADEVLDGHPGETQPEARTLVTVAGHTTVSSEGAEVVVGDHEIGSTYLTERDVVVEPGGGPVARVTFRHLNALSPFDASGEPEVDGPFVDLGSSIPAVVVVGSCVVIADDGGIVAVS